MWELHRKLAKESLRNTGKFMWKLYEHLLGSRIDFIFHNNYFHIMENVWQIYGFPQIPHRCIGQK